ncbi:MAG: hypothetical protein EBY83_05480 [Verrucomicrobia bacterium]|nr:hypothetical protein [Verrucomicrobiota bacterium]
MWQYACTHIIGISKQSSKCKIIWTGCVKKLFNNFKILLFSGSFIHFGKSTINAMKIWCNCRMQLFWNRPILEKYAYQSLITVNIASNLFELITNAKCIYNVCKTLYLCNTICNY